MNRTVRKATRMGAAALALGLALGACDDGTVATGPSGDEVEITEEVVRLFPGDAHRLGWEGSATSGVAWVARNADVASVGNGVVRAVAPGMTWVVAEAGDDADSVRVAVSFAQAPAGALAFTLGEETSPLHLVGMSRIVRPLTGGDSYTVLSATVGSEAVGDVTFEDFIQDTDTLVFLRLEGTPAEGFRTVTPWELVDREGGFRFRGAEGALIWIRDPVDPLRSEMYVPVDAIELEFDRVVTPAVEGPATGVVEGRMSFEAAGLVVEQGADGESRVVGQVSDRTTRVFAEFELVQRIRPLGGVRASIEGGPLPHEPLWQPSPQTAVHEGGLALRTVGVDGDGNLFATQLWLGEPGSGTFSFGSVELEELMDRSAEAADRAWVWTESGSRAEVEAGEPLSNLGLSVGGTLEVTQWVAPGDDTWGLVSGTLEVEQEMAWGGEAGATQTLRLEILTPVAPLSRDAYVHQPFRGETVELGPWHARVGNGPITLPGQVKETGLYPVSGVELTLRWDGGEASVVTDDDGRFLFSGLHDGDYEVEIHVPDGYGLARGQRRVVGPLNLRADFPSTLPVHLSDAEGNGAVDIVAGQAGANRHVDGVVVRVRHEGSDEVVATAVTGDRWPDSGMTSMKLQPGRYELDLELPDGFRFADGQPSTVTVEVFKGRRRTVWVPVEPN